jgi:hypothetical protein
MVNRTGGGAALKLRARLNPAASPRRAPVSEVPSPSFRAHMEAFGSTAARKRARPRRWPPEKNAHIVFGLFGVYFRSLLHYTIHMTIEVKVVTFVKIVNRKNRKS